MLDGAVGRMRLPVTRDLPFMIGLSGKIGLGGQHGTPGDLRQCAQQGLILAG